MNTARAAYHLPEFLCDVRNERRKHDNEVMHRLAHKTVIGAAVSIKRIHKFHYARYAGVEVEADADVIRAFFLCIIEHIAQILVLFGEVGHVALGVYIYLILVVIHKAEHSVEEPVRALHSRVAPLKISLRRCRKEDKQPCGVRAVLGDNLLGADNIAERFAHLGAVLKNHALCEQIVERLVYRHITEVIEHLGKEPGIEQVKYGVLHTADVLVDAHPVLNRLLGERLFVVLGVAVTQIIPRRAHKGVHGVYLASCRLAALGARSGHKCGAGGKRRFAESRELHILRQHNRQILLGNRHRAAVVTVYNRNGRTPVSLTGDEPVAQLEVGLVCTDFVFLKIFYHLGHSFFVVHAGKFARIYHDALRGKRLGKS